MPSNTDFFLFKDYIKPEWEDTKNKNGGRWIYDIAWDKSKHQFISQHTENVWTKLILSLIGNLFEEMEYFICGVVLSIRHYNNKISIWTCNLKEDINIKIGNLFKKNCELTQNDKISLIIEILKMDMNLYINYEIYFNLIIKVIII